MKQISLGLTLGLAALIGVSAPVLADSPVVKVTLDIRQPSLFDQSQRDTFKGSVDDPGGITNLTVECSAGASGLLGMGRVDEACSVKGNGLIKNPNNPAQTIERIGYAGGFKVNAKQNGFVDARTILANYARVGAASAETASFGGNAIMMPENPSASAKALGAALIRNLQEKATGGSAVQFDTQIDSVRLENFTIPHIGQLGSVSCSWTGDLIFAYANDQWQGAFDVVCGKERFRLEGNMPLRNVGDNSLTQTYAVNLVVPGAGSGDPFASADPFATVNGIVGTLNLVNSGRKTEDEVYENVKVTGDLTGTNVPSEVVRGYALIMTIFARTFFGA